MFRELFYYILGGLTFLPLCFIAGLVHFYLTAPLAQPDSSDAGITVDLEITQERKVMALDLAAANAALLSEKENSRGKDKPQGSTTAPKAAKRLGPGPPAGSSSRPHLAGQLTVRPRFEASAEVAASAATPTNRSSANSNATGAKQANGAQAASVGSTGNDAADKKPPNAAAAAAGGASYMSQMYKGLLDYRKNGGRKATLSAAGGANGAQSQSEGSQGGAGVGGGTADATLAGTMGKESFHCILKAPILYLYSSDDISDPNTECHAAIDLRGKRVSIFVAGLGDTMGEPDDSEDDDDDGESDHDHNNDRNDDRSNDNERSTNSGAPSGKPQPGPLAAVKSAAVAETGAYDTQSSADSDASISPAAAKRRASSRVAKATWKKAKRAAVRDGELFMKRNAIRILGSWSTRSGTKAGGSRTSAPGQGRQQRPQWFLFCKSTTSMEDWYQALLQASFLPEDAAVKAASGSGWADVDIAPSLRPGDDPLSPVFSRDDMASLLVSLDSLPDPIPLRWLNAMVGRIFYSIYRTAWLEDYITRKMMKKISRVKTPGFLGDIKVQEVDVGRSAPGFSRPMLKSLTSDGEASMEVACHYTGEVRITIATSVTISLGSRFKPYTIPLVLAVVLRSLEGNLLLQVKPPPSNRLWFGFTALPKLEIDVEPVVSERKVQWGMVTRLIEGRIRELLTESIVVPNMDDVPFFDTRSLPYRGAIFADAAKRADDSLSTAATHEVAKASQIEEATAAASVKKAHQSAPASGATIPLSLSSNPTRKADAIDSKALRGLASDVNSTAMADKKDGTALRNRKSSTLNPAFDQQQQQLQQISSPAIAGLSDLLSRDLAAGGSLSSDKVSTSPSRSDSRLSLQSQPQHHQQQQQTSQNRKSWFGGASRTSSTASVGSGGSSSLSLPSGNRPKSGKAREQSSLAWGNASLSHVPSRPGQRVLGSPQPGPSQDLATATTALAEDGRSSEGQGETAGASIQQSIDSGNGGVDFHRRNKSISSISSSFLGTDESGVSASTDQLNASIEAASQAETASSRPFGDGAEQPTPTAEDSPASASRAPSLMVSKASEDSIAALSSAAGPKGGSGESSVGGGGAVGSGSEAAREVSRLDVDTIGDAPGLTIESPSSIDRISLHHGPSSPSPSSDSVRSDQNTISAADSPIQTHPTQQGDDSASLSRSLGASSGAAGSGYDGSSISRTASSSSVSSSSVKSMHGFAPPPRRSAAPPSQSSLPSSRREADAGLSAVHQSRYGLGSGSGIGSHAGGSRDSVADFSAASPSASEGSTSAATALLLNSWKQAKASMADKESRQAAAKDAKDAIKRGWASWNSKRNEKNNGGGGNSGGFNDTASSASWSSRSGGLLSSSSLSSTSHGGSRFSLAPSASSSWYGVTDSSPPHDPASMGTGLEGRATRSDIHSSAASAASPGDHVGGGGAGSGSRSEAEHRAHLRRNLQDDRDDSGSSARSSSSGRQPYRELRASKAAQRQNDPLGGQYETPSAQAPSGQWSAEVPSLAAPAPALQRKTSDNPQKRIDYAASRSELSQGSGGLEDQAGAPTTTAVPLRRRVSSTASVGPGGGVSFMPPAPTTTTSLASTSSFAGSSLSPIHGTSPADGKTPLPTSPSGTVRNKSEVDAVAAPRQSTAAADAAAQGRPQADDSVRGSPVAVEAGIDSSAANVSALSPQVHTSPRLHGVAMMGQSGPPMTPSSPNAAKVQVQPGRAAMMAVPGIPSMQRSTPQSFSAPPPPDLVPTSSQPRSATGSPTAMRMGAMFKGLPVFGGKTGDAGGITSAAPSAALAEVVEQPSAANPETTAGGLDTAPSAEAAAAEEGFDLAATPDIDGTPSSGLGLTNLEPAPVEASNDAVLGDDKAGEVAATEPLSSGSDGQTETEDTLDQPPSASTTSSGTTLPLTGAAAPETEATSRGPPAAAAAAAAEEEDDTAVLTPVAGSFAQVAAAEGPATDAQLAESQLDIGPAVEAGNREIKLDDGLTEQRETRPL